MIKIREIKRADFKEFSKNEKSYAKELKKNPEFGLGSYGWTADKKYLKRTFSEISKGIAKGTWIVLIAEDDGRMVGMASVQPSKWVDGSHVGELGFSIIKEYRGKGIGFRLAKETIGKSKRKYEILSAGAFSKNKPSNNLLKKLGFRKWGIAPKFSKRGKLYIDSTFYYLKLK